MDKENKKTATPVEEKTMTKEQAEELAKKMTEESAGKYVLVHAYENDTKLTLRELVEKLTAKNNKGKKPAKKEKTRDEWHTFCVSWNKLKCSGLVIAKISSFRVDKKNNVYMIVDPLMQLDGVTPLFASPVWEFALSCGVMWAPYGTSLKKKPEHFNTDAAYGTLGYTVGEDEMALRRQMWEDMIAGKFTLRTLQDALNTPTEYEEYAKELYSTWQTVVEEKNLTYLKERIMREEMTEKDMVQFCEKEHEAYKKLGLTGAASIAEEAEAVIAYYADLHEKEKEAKKEAKRAKKAN